ncbi:MAG: DUF1850 domain-containing protein [Nitriliruptoraceae bacterium]|nr:DUF1850 domain-containing protein [Nitriliruptoraceae bacterium]
MALVLLGAGATALLVTTSDNVTSAASRDGTWFEVRDPESDRTLHRRAVHPGERIVMTHVHSVTRREVVETFGIAEDGTLTLEEMVFDEPGPNLPTGPERFGERDTTFETVDGVYRVIHHGFRIGTVGLRVGQRSVDHTLTFEDGEQVRLLDLTRAGGPVELTAG